MVTLAADRIGWEPPLPRCLFEFSSRKEGAYCLEFCVAAQRVLLYVCRGNVCFLVFAAGLNSRNEYVITLLLSRKEIVFFFFAFHSFLVFLFFSPLFLTFFYPSFCFFSSHFHVCFRSLFRPSFFVFRVTYSFTAETVPSGVGVRRVCPP